VIVRCGRCKTEFDAPSEGVFACPSCGTSNEVRRQQPDSGIVAPLPPPDPEPPSPRVICPECGFGFIVGPVDTAPCPMCGSVVDVGAGDEADEADEGDDS
jgi:rRNA maturation endonuclease Nob1